MIEAIAEEFGTTPDAVMGKSRVGSLPDARHWYWWWLVNGHGISNVGVAALMEVDESSVRHAIRKCARLSRRGETPKALQGAV